LGAFFFGESQDISGILGGV